MRFAGLANYIELFHDPVFWRSFGNNLIWIVLTVVLTMSISLLLAVLINKKFIGRTFFRGFFYFPCVVAGITVAIIWRWIFNPSIGFINEFFRAIGSDYQQAWLSDERVAFFCVFFASLWQGIGQPMLLFIAGLQGVSPDVLEAASIDGATGPKRFFLVTIPMMKETFIMVGATLIISAMKVYDVVKGLTDGGPNNASQMLATYMYSQAFEYNRVGYGTSIAVVMVLVMLLIIVPYIRFTARSQSGGDR